MKKIEGFKWYW